MAQSNFIVREALFSDIAILFSASFIFHEKGASSPDVPIR